MSELFTLGKNINFENLEGGIKRKVLAYGEKVMLCEVHVPKGAEVKKHEHIHHQISYIKSGKCEYTIGSETCKLEAGDSAIIVENISHSIVAIEDTVVIDVFSPMREDFI